MPHAYFKGTHFDPDLPLLSPIMNTTIGDFINFNSSRILTSFCFLRKYLAKPDSLMSYYLSIFKDKVGFLFNCLKKSGSKLPKFYMIEFPIIVVFLKSYKP